MKIDVAGISKRFQKHNWVIDDFSHIFMGGYNYGISGANGSGKSTLLKIISGYLTPTKGKVQYSHNSSVIKLDDLFKVVNVAAPYDGLIEEFTLSELIDFHFQFKKWRNGWNKQKAIEFLDFDKQLNKQLSDFSSGMRQRVKIVLCLCTDGLLYLLDEPTSNLDEAGKAWYRHLVTLTKSPDQITVIASNEQHDFVDIQEMINL